MAPVTLDSNVHWFRVVASGESSSSIPRGMGYDEENSDVKNPNTCKAAS
jgi:hypothetical protein